MEARGKIKKYAPLLAGIGVKVVAVVGLLFGALTLLVTKALVVAKLAFLAAAALGIHKYFSGGSLSSISKVWHVINYYDCDSDQVNHDNDNDYDDNNM